MVISGMTHTIIWAQQTKNSNSLRTFTYIINTYACTLVNDSATN